MAKGNVRPWVWGALALVGAALGGLWWWTSEPSAARSAKPGASGAPSSGEPGQPALAPSARGSTAAQPPLRPRRPVMTPEVERVRTRVLDALASRAPGATPGTAPAAAKAAPAALKDRTGELNPATMRVMNDEFMPMVAQCYDEAHERNPLLRGTLALNLDLAGAEELGTIVEALEPAPDINELADDDLIDCVRQSAFSLRLPQPPKSGRTSRQLTMNFGEPDPKDAAR